MAAVLPKRSEQPVEHTWAVESVFPSVEAWEAALADLEGRIPKLEGFRGRLGEAPETLLAWLRELEALQVDLGKVITYSSMLHDADTGDAAGAERWQRVLGLAARVEAAASFHETEIATLGDERLREWTGALPELEQYRQHFEALLRRREHIRSAEVEETLALAADPLGTPFVTHTLLVDADLKFGTATDAQGEARDVAQGTMDALLESPEREVRRQGWEQYADGYLSVKNTLGALLAGSVKTSVFRARVRRYASAREAAMSQNFIPAEVYDNVTETFRANLDIWHRYWRVRRQALGLDKLAVYDIWAPLTPREPDVPYSKALDWLVDGMAPLGAEYQEPLARGLREERWVDVYPNQGKRGGAYSGGSHGTPPFSLMNWTGSLGQFSVLAHEMGHSMHSYFSRQAQSPIYSEYSIFVAEVASNFNQALVRAHLLAQEADPHFQVAVIGEAMANFHRYLFIMPTLARFEDEIHRRVERGEGLTADNMSALMLDLFREGYGGEVELDEARIGITWAQFPHLFMNFYVYQYATGISAANALAAQLLEGDAGLAGRYLEFLKAGSSRYPLDALRLTGIDMTSPEPIERAFQVLAGMIDRLEQLLPQVSGPGAAAPSRD